MYRFASVQNFKSIVKFEQNLINAIALLCMNFKTILTIKLIMFFFVIYRTMTTSPECWSESESWTSSEWRSS